MSKRVLDVVVASVASVLTLPIVLLLALLLAFELRASPFFVQERVGRHGRRFRMVKLRTLPTSTPMDATKYDLVEVQVPPLSARVRRFHLDELPQLWLVVAGRMSLVGPRPEMPRLHAEFSPDVQRERSRVRPGCTGLWQISVAAGGLMHEHPEYDVAYVRSASLQLDLWILWQTRGMLIGRRRWITLADAPLHPMARELKVLQVDTVAVEDPAAI